MRHLGVCTGMRVGVYGAGGGSAEGSGRYIASSRRLECFRVVRAVSNYNAIPNVAEAIDMAKFI